MFADLAADILQILFIRDYVGNILVEPLSVSWFILGKY